jgi:hypothetical protein
MNIKYKEDPGAWCKSTLLTVLALLVLSSLLRWRHVLTVRAWTVVLLVLACVAIAVWIRPRWFRSYYRFSTWSGFWSSQWVARGFLALIFILLILPAGVIMRLLGKDPLHLRRSTGMSSYWRPAKQHGSLDRLF